MQKMLLQDTYRQHSISTGIRILSVMMDLSFASLIRYFDVLHLPFMKIRQHSDYISIAF
jgi:hypothetical protein